MPYPVRASQVGLDSGCCIMRCGCCVQVSALEDMWKAAPDAKVEDLEAAEVRHQHALGPSYYAGRSGLVAPGLVHADRCARISHP